MGIVAHFWNPVEKRPESAALDIIQLNEHPSLEFIADTLKHAFDKTDLRPSMIYRTIVESSGGHSDEMIMKDERWVFLMNGKIRYSLRNRHTEITYLYHNLCASF